MIKVAIIGLGHMGKRYAKMILRGEIKTLSLACVCTRSGQAAQWLNENCDGVIDKGEVKLYRNENELYENAMTAFDAIIITTPHKLHPDTAIRAFRAGKHVLCEKPAGIDVISARQMYSESKFADVVYELIFHQRTYSRFIKLKQMIDSGEIGRIQSVRQIDTGYYRTRSYHASGEWRSSWQGEGGGALINQGQHLLDMWQWLFGMPQEVGAFINWGKYNDFIVDDEAIINFNYENGMTGVFILSTGEAHKERYIEISGTKGHIRIDDDKLRIWRFSRDLEEYSKNATCSSTQELSEDYEEIDLVSETGDEPYRKVLENFGETVIARINKAHSTENQETDAKEDKAITNGQDGINTLELTCGAYLSAFKGKKVRIPVNGEEYRDFLDEMRHNESEVLG